jgi:HTH-type transcriptional regulator/antitoxin HipB
MGQRLGLSQERISAIERKPESISVDQLLTVLMVLEAELVVQRKADAPAPEWSAW